MPIALLRPLSALVAALLACAPSDRAADARDAPGGRPGSDAAPAVPPLRTDTAGAAWVERTLAGMTLRQRVAQLVFPWISGAAPAANAEEQARMLRWVQRDEVGGLIVSTGAPAALAAKLNAAQARAAVPLLVVSDLETGPGMRLTPGGTRMPSAMAFGAAGDTALARAAGRATAEEARAVGIHATLGPVLDVNVDPANPIINVRSFGASPAAVAALASAWVRGAADGGLLTVGKHFPGHGDTRVDSHVGLAAVPGDSARLDSVEMVPFRAALRAGMDGVLVGHIAATGVEGPDAPPASLSPRMVGGWLRGGLGAEGIVFTDALNMGGVTRRYSVTEASIRALLAGADALLQPPGHAEVIDGIVAAVEAGRIPRARIDDAARRVLRAKAAAGVHRTARVDAAQVAARVGTEAHRAVAREVAARSITLVRDRGNVLPLARGSRVLHVVYATGDGAGGGVARGLEAGGVSVETARVGPSTAPAAYAALRRRAGEVDAVVVSVAVVPVQYRALGIDAAAGAFVRGLAEDGRRHVVVSLGSPYLLGAFPDVPAYLLAWDRGDPAEGAAAAVLRGAAPAPGRLPVALPPYHARGEGGAGPVAEARGP